jgi:aspartate aminotransferase
MTAHTPTAAAERDADMVVLATGDVRVPVHPAAPPALPRLADQPYQVTAGIADLRAAIAAHARGAAVIDADQVLITPGARQAILLVMAAALRARTGEQPAEVLLPTPYWSSYPTLVEMAGGVAVPVPPAEGARLTDPDRLAAACSPATRIVVINSPRNPDGAVLTAEELRDVVEWAARRNLVVLFDQVYRGVPGVAAPTPSVLDLWPRLPEHCAVVDGLTKSHALAGIRVGWTLLPDALRPATVGLASHLVGGTCTAAQEAALAVLADGAAFRGRLGTALTANLDQAMATLDGIPGLVCRRPSGGIFLFPDLRGWLAGPAPAAARRDIAAWLADRHRVAVVDGAAFGAPGFVRLSFALPAPRLRAGLDRFRTALTAQDGT